MWMLITSRPNTVRSASNPSRMQPRRPSANSARPMPNAAKDRIFAELTLSSSEMSLYDAIFKAS